MRPKWLRRRRAPVMLTITPPRPAALWPDESDLLAEIARSAATIPHSGQAAFEGMKIADFLRRRIPAAPDAELLRLLALFLFVTRHMSMAADQETCPAALLWEALGAAALHLTEIDRMTGVAS